MLKRIKIKNLACFNDSDDNQIEFKPLTVIVGPNNSGKSTVINAINLVKQVALQGLMWSSMYFPYQSFLDAVYMHDQNRTIQVNMGLVTPEGGDINISINPYAYLGGYEINTTISGDIKNHLLRKLLYIYPQRYRIPPQTGVSRNIDIQMLNPVGSDIIAFYLERWTDRDPRWNEAETWLRKIDPDLSLLKVPLRGSSTSLVSEQTIGEDTVEINLTYQGVGIQNATTTAAALVFSEENTTILIEEPENHLHPYSQEVLVDLMNKAVMEWKKQVIFTTHSWNMLLPYISDVGKGSARGKDHIKIDASMFKAVSTKKEGGRITIRELDLSKEFKDVKEELKNLFG